VVGATSTALMLIGL